MNKPLSKEELIKRLKAIAADNTPRIENPGAMCYSPMVPSQEHFSCEICGGDCVSVVFSRDSHTLILDYVKEMSDLGYDVKVETVCRNCAEKIKKELYPNMKSEDDRDFDWKTDIQLNSINHIFYFRTSPDTEYHRAIANDNNQYKALVTLMLDMPMYGGDYDESHYVADEIDTLEFMTGIKFND